MVSLIVCVVDFCNVWYTLNQPHPCKLALANEAMDTRKSWTSIITTGTTSIQAIDAGKNRDAIKPVLQSTSVVGALSSKQKVIDVDEKSNDSDGNESYYSC